MGILKFFPIINNTVQSRIKITSIINEINFNIIYKRGGGGPWRPHIAACGDVSWWPFWPTHATCHALVDRLGPALSADAWQLAWVG